jgi:hypothetical protein
MLTLAVLVSLSVLWPGPPDAASSDPPPLNDTALVRGLSWTDVDRIADVQVFEMLGEQTRGNYERIRTWKGVYAVRAKQLLSSDFANKLIGTSPTDEDVSGLVQESDFIFHFAIDMKSGPIYRSKETSKMTVHRDGSNNPISMPHRGPSDNRSILTSESYTFFMPQLRAPGFTFLHGHPEAKNRRAAYREDANRWKNQHFGDLIDPRFLYQVDMRNHFWDEIGVQTQALKGTLGEKLLVEGRGRLGLSKAVGADGTWYRIRCRYSGPEGASRIVTSFWSSTAGFNPVLRIASADEAGAKPVSVAEWQWRKVDGIYIPSRVIDRLYSGPEGRRSYVRDLVLQECTLNLPLDVHQFDYQGLGMKDGDLIIDKIDRVVYKLQGGEPVKLGNFYDNYGGGFLSGLSSPWLFSVFSVGNVLVLGLFVFFYRRFKNALRASSGP